MKTISPHFTLLPAVSLVGCATPPLPIIQPPPSQSAREKFGRIGEVALTPAPGIDIQTFAEWSAAAAFPSSEIQLALEQISCEISSHVFPRTTNATFPEASKQQLCSK